MAEETLYSAFQQKFTKPLTGNPNRVERLPKGLTVFSKTADPHWQHPLEKTLCPGVGGGTATPLPLSARGLNPLTGVWLNQGLQQSFAFFRSRARESIRPGKYGYGKLPFSLPLHRDAAEGTAPRFKRHRTDRDGEPPPPPPPPPHPPPRTRERKARRASSREDVAGRGKALATAGAAPPPPRESQAQLPVEGAARPQRQGGGGAESGSGPGDGRAGPGAASEERTPPAEAGAAPTLRNEPLAEEEHRGKLVTDSPAPQPSPPVAPTDRRPPQASTEPPHSEPTDSPAPAAEEGPEESGPATERAALPPSQVPSPAGSRPPRAQGELRLTHQVLRNQSAAPERRGPRAGKSHPTRSRSQRQNEPRTSPRAPPVDRPAPPRPAQPDIWLLHRGSPVQFHARGQRPRTDGRPEEGEEVPQWSLYYPGTESFHCDGESRQFKACRQEVKLAAWDRWGGVLPGGGRGLAQLSSAALPVPSWALGSLSVGRAG